MGNKTIAGIILAVTAFIANAAAETPASPIATLVTGPTVAWGPCPPIFAGDCALAVLQGNPGKPNADVILRVGPGQLLPRHKHSSAERMMLVAGEMRVTYDGAAPIALTPSTYAYGPAGLPHEALCTSGTPCYLFIAFEGPVDADLVK